MLSDDQIERWSRQILLPEVGGRGQLRLLEARVGVTGGGPGAARCVDLLERAGVRVADGVPDGVDVLVDLDADDRSGAVLARRAVALGVPLIRGRHAGAGATVETLVGRPCGCCVSAERASAGGDPDGLAATAEQAWAALLAAEVLATLLEPPSRGRRQRFDLSRGDFTGGPLVADGCAVCS
jgi:hypothetical protein